VSNKKELRYAFFSLKNSQKEPLQVPTRDPYGDSCPLLGLFYISFKLLIKFPLNKETFPFYQTLYERSDTSCSSKAVLLRKQTPISGVLISIYVRGRSEVAPNPGVLKELPHN